MVRSIFSQVFSIKDKIKECDMRHSKRIKANLCQEEIMGDEEHKGTKAGIVTKVFLKIIIKVGIL